MCVCVCVHVCESPHVCESSLQHKGQKRASDVLQTIESEDLSPSSSGQDCNQFSFTKKRKDYAKNPSQGLVEKLSEGTEQDVAGECG